MVLSTFKLSFHIQRFNDRFKRRSAFVNAYARLEMSTNYFDHFNRGTAFNILRVNDEMLISEF